LPCKKLTPGIFLHSSESFRFEQMVQEVILVNEQDEQVGVMEKMEAHRKGALHRAFSVFIFDSKGRMLLHQRSLEKYHGGLLWTNACCSHPMPGELTEQAAARRLKEEMGFSTDLEKIFSFLYQAEVENGLTEHEYDHVFAGEYDGGIHPHVGEVASYKFENMDAIRNSINSEPSKFTTWFRIAFPSIEKWWKEKYKV
jgi:isopentenyl-diphosphate Delta-isomerase